jgi:hypothetical protein
MKIDLHHFDDCPYWKQGFENLQSALSSDKIKPGINLIRVESDEDVAKDKFLGSPSSRVNRQDYGQKNALATTCVAGFTRQKAVCGVSSAPKCLFEKFALSNQPHHSRAESY